MIKTSDLFVQCLEAEGVTRIFGVPSEENLDFLESLRTSSISLVLTRHEQAALDEKGVTLIEVPVDYSENEKVLNDELSKRTCIL